SAAVGIAGASEADSTAPVRQAVARFVGHRRSRRPLDKLLVVTAGLCDEVGDDAMEDRSVVMPRANVLEEVPDGQRGAFRIQLDQEAAHIRVYAYERGLLRRRRRGDERKQCETEEGCFSHGLARRLRWKG